VIRGLSKKTGGQASRPDPVNVSVRQLVALQEQARALPLKPGRIRSLSSGGYVSAFKGRGMEFDEVRPYQPGDDVRCLDWRVTARRGKPHTKLFREERERAVLLWTDFRAPMFFATRGEFKSVHAARLAALVAWSALQHGDRLGGLVFNESRHHELRPLRNSRAVLRVIERLVEYSHYSGATPSNGVAGESAGHALARLRRVAHPGSLVVLISDFRHLDDAADAHLMQLARHNEVVLAFVHDALEAALPAAGRYRIGDGRRDLLVDGGNAGQRADYAAHFAQRRERLEGWSRRFGARLVDCPTHEEPLAVLQRGFGLRSR
jgi:uncharacterized protein (DUF58 family)